MRHRQVIPTESLGQIAATSGTYTQLTQTIPDDTNNVTICLPVEATRLQCKPVCTNWVRVEAHLVPTICKIWAPHIASGFYIGNAWGHYCCHEIYINDTKHTRTCNTVFFKHK